MARRKNQEPELLSEFLETHTIASLKELGAYLPGPLPTRKGDLVAHIHELLTDPAQLKKLWGELDKNQRAAVSEVVHGASSPYFEADVFRAKYGDDPNWGKKDRWSSWIRTPSRLQLFIYRTGYHKPKIPSDLKAMLQQLVFKPPEVKTKAIDDLPASVSQDRQYYDYTARKYISDNVEIPLTQRETELMAALDLQAVLRLIDTGKVRVTEKRQQPNATTVRAISKLLHGGDFYLPDDDAEPYTTVPAPMRAFAWPMIVQAAGLAKRTGPKIALTPAGRKAMSAPPHEVLRKAWQRWLKSKVLDEFNRIHTIKGQTGKAKRTMTALNQRRAPIVSALKTMKPNSWISFDDFSRYMQVSGFKFTVCNDTWELYIEDPNYGSLGYDGFDSWEIIQARYLLAFLFEYMATMGLIDVAYIPPSLARMDFSNLWGVDDYDALSYYDGLQYFRINNLGAWCLEMVDDYQPAKPQQTSRFTVLPNMDIVATEAVPAGDVLILEQFAASVSDNVWHIELDQLLKSVENGQSITTMVEFLKANAGNDLPGTVETFFSDVSERVSRLSDAGPARLIEVKDEATARLITHDRELSKHCMLAGDRHIAVPTKSEAAFRRGLRKLGYSLSKGVGE